MTAELDMLIETPEYKSAPGQEVVKPQLRMVDLNLLRHSFTDLLPADLRRYLDSVDYQNSARYGGVQCLTQFLTADAP